MSPKSKAPAPPPRGRKRAAPAHQGSKDSSAGPRRSSRASGSDGASRSARPGRRKAQPEVENAQQSQSASNDREALAPVDGPKITVRGARTHNLRSVDIDLPRNKLVVITGPSGCGKSSLAFDTVFAEGQRRYVESLSAAARQHLAQLPKPDVDLIEGLSPSVAISQDNRARNPRSTVGTLTEIYDYLRLLFARVGEVYSHKTGARMEKHSIEDMVDSVMSLGPGNRFSVIAPIVQDATGDQSEVVADLRRTGFVRVAVDGEVRDLSEPIELDPNTRHSLEVYVDRLKLKDGIESRLADSLEIAARLGSGRVKVLAVDGQELHFSEQYADLEHGIAYPEITPSMFSYNSPAGACPTCDGLGYRRVFDPRRIVPNPARSLDEGAIVPATARLGATLRKRLPAVYQHLGVDTSAPWETLEAQAQIALLEGTGQDVVEGLGQPFEGVRPWLQRRYDDALARGRTSDDDDSGPLAELAAFLGDVVCPTCDGDRLRLEARMVRVEGKNLPALAKMPLRDLRAFVDGLSFEAGEQEIAQTVLEQVRKRLAFLIEVGLSYLTLDRPAPTLSGGESQRIRLATQVGAALVGITYILDEPSIGLHQRDNDRLIATLLRLRDLGNSVIVVEHDEDTMRAADWVVDMGPGAGVAGGKVVAAGSLERVIATSGSATGAYLSGRLSIEPPSARRRSSGRSLVIRNARGNNLAGVTARFPLGVMTCVTGVSGSGKSSLVVKTLLPEAARVLNNASSIGLEHDGVDGLEHLDKVIHVDQAPIGRSPRSNPATFTGIFAELRSVFAKLPEAKIRGFTASRFSFNVKGGRCEACQGEGVRRVEMHFLPDIFVTCQTCGGRRYNRETLAITMRGKSIADVLDLCVSEACEFFASHPAIRHKLEVLRDVGLGYVSLGQSALTLSGGEAQRIKLARELAKRSTGNTLFVLDEPTTGLHFGDVRQLLAVLQRLVDEGNTVIVIEHNLDVIKCADHVIDVGPEGGDEGGRVVVSGTPEKVAASQASHTGRFLRSVLASRP